ncbi:limbic system-associated membrane protein-like isoform X2 [Tigriopus californicus]|uniref:limbic system-associated membrane protein-like isoform X2 n=1 Tax=Tigriopus californicus TaxID=6832 RepID=UPI0027DA5C38|nr:limbic system-associated membrane protein-like isoform X2 [Tigriopus californicus]
MKSLSSQMCPTKTFVSGLHLIQNVLFLLWLAPELSGSKVKILAEPGFIGNLKNVTVPEGRDVMLTCTVKNLESHKVAWIHYDRSAILTVQNHVITRNPRIAVSQEGHQTWNLIIKNVQTADQGAYMCQINTAKAKTRLGFLNVVVPPRIEDSLSSGDKVRTEGSNVTLECTARGSPPPKVTWKRENGLNINTDKSQNISVPHVEGEMLRLYKVSRLDMGAYMCIASNGVPPAVSKRIHLGIDFPPMMWIPAQQTSAISGNSITLTCFVEAHPEALTFWEHDGRMIQSGRRVYMTNKPGTPKYKVEMKLTITTLERGDFGNYKCIAKNPRGQTDGSITLTEEIPPTTTTLEPSTTAFVPTTTATTTHNPRKRKKHGKKRKHKEFFNGLTNNEQDDFSSNDDPTNTKYHNEEQYQPHSTNGYESNSWFNARSSSSSSFPRNQLVLGYIYPLPILIPTLPVLMGFFQISWFK